MDVCRKLQPVLLDDDGHAVACHLVNPPNGAAAPDQPRKTP
jgi:hypothetical protein